MTPVGGRPERNELKNTPQSAPPARAARTGDRPADRPEGETQTAAPPDVLWDVAAVAAYLRVSSHAIYKMTARRAAVRFPTFASAIGCGFDEPKSTVVDAADRIQSRRAEPMRQHAAEITHGHHPPTQAP